MDPNANLSEQEQILVAMRNGTADRQDRARLRELQTALRTWISNGGCLPDLITDCPYAALSMFAPRPTRTDAGDVHTLNAIRLLDHAHMLGAIRRECIDQAFTQYGRDGALISGCVRDHFPPAVKDHLRTLARQITDAHDRAQTAWRSAGRTMRTFRVVLSIFNASR